MRASILSSLFLGLSFVAGCSAAPGDDAAVASSAEALSTTTDTFVTLRADMRKCASPMCGGYYVKDVNKTTAEQYVSGLDYASCELGDDVQRTIAAALGDVVLQGRLSAKSNGYRSFVVTGAWRGMPGVVVDDPTAVFYTAPQIECFRAPCISTAHKLNSTATPKAYDSIDVTAAAKPNVDQMWLKAQVTGGSAIVVGTLQSQTSGRVTTHVLAAEQVFLKLPVTTGPCLELPTLECPDATPVRAYSRDANLCLNDAGCVGAKFCPMFMPACEEGYALSSWTSTSGCLAFACDPTFAH